MTKAIRIENADLSDHGVAIYTEYLVDGVWVRQNSARELNMPTGMLTETIWNTKRLVIEEVK